MNQLFRTLELVADWDRTWDSECWCSRGMVAIWIRWSADTAVPTSARLRMRSSTICVVNWCKLGGSPQRTCVLATISALVGKRAKVSGVGMQATVHDLGLLCRAAVSSFDSREPCLDLFSGCVTYSSNATKSAKTWLSSLSTSRYTLPTYVNLLRGQHG